MLPDFIYRRLDLSSQTSVADLARQAKQAGLKTQVSSTHCSTILSKISYLCERRSPSFALPVQNRFARPWNVTRSQILSRKSAPLSWRTLAVPALVK